MGRLSPSPPSACARPVSLLVSTTASMPLSHHLKNPGSDPVSACSCHQGSAPHAAEQMVEDFIRAARALFLARNKRNMRVARTDERTGLSHVCLHTAVCIGLLASCDMRAGVVWLESANRRGKAWREDLSSTDVLLRLQMFFREADLEFLDELRDPSRTSLSAATFATAARAAEEYKLSDWVRTRNLDGTAIPTARLIDEHQRRLAEQPPSVRLRSVPSTANSTGRNWAFRWRRSQGAMFGKLRTEADVAVPEKREKARGCVVTRPSSCLFGAREFPKTRVTGSGVWRKWRQGSRQNVAHFLGAVLGPQAQKPCVSSHLPDLWRPENGTRFETPLGPF